MVTRRKSVKKRKYLGLRFNGAGNVKNRRGSGNRGGRGNAGLHKHKYTWITKYAPDYFGAYGFVRPNTTKVPVINLYEIDQRATANKLEKKDGKLYFEFAGKVLGTGILTVPVTIKALSWSKNVEEKIKTAGGTLVAFEKKATGVPKAKVR